ncbi:MAG: hypothetical protein M1833_000722 [Piccolia ochrophora]|nr:MAG: hypothetical protein M1833_000722 [Piccolia ochrophora]
MEDRNSFLSGSKLSANGSVGPRHLVDDATKHLHHQDAVIVTHSSITTALSTVPAISLETLDKTPGSSVSDQVPFPFARLPIELRHQIYLLCLSWDGHALIDQDSTFRSRLKLLRDDPGTSMTMSFMTTPNLSLLRVDRAMHEEAVGVFYGMMSLQVVITEQSHRREASGVSSRKTFYAVPGAWNERTRRHIRLFGEVRVSVYMSKTLGTPNCDLACSVLRNSMEALYEVLALSRPSIRLGIKYLEKTAMPYQPKCHHIILEPFTRMKHHRLDLWVGVPDMYATYVLDGIRSTRPGVRLGTSANGRREPNPDVLYESFGGISEDGGSGYDAWIEDEDMDTVV